MLAPHQNNRNIVYAKAYMGNILWWAGTETAQQYGGYMDGMVESGLWAAHAVFKTMVEPIIG